MKFVHHFIGTMKKHKTRENLTRKNELRERKTFMTENDNKK